jgi:hypothetical protein
MERFNVLRLTRMGTINLHVRPAAKLLGTIARSTRCGRGPAALRQRSHSRFAFMESFLFKRTDLLTDHEPTR